MSTMPTKETARNAEAPHIPEPQAAPLATRPVWHRPILTRIDIKATLVGVGSNNDGQGPTTN